MTSLSERHLFNISREKKVCFLLLKSFCVRWLTSLLLNLLFYKWSTLLTLFQGLACKIFCIHFRYLLWRTGHDTVLTGHKREALSNTLIRLLPEQVKNLNVAIITIGPCTVSPTWSNYVQGSANTTSFQKSSYVVWRQKKTTASPCFPA